MTARHMSCPRTGDKVPKARAYEKCGHLRATVTVWAFGQVAKGTGVNISSRWHEQYDRMHKSHRKLRTVSRGEGTLSSSDEARDALYHFFQDAYHVRDWVQNDQQSRIERISIKDSDVLCLCADLCNGTKHLKLKESHCWTGDTSTTFTSQSVAVRPGAAGSGQPPQPALYWWTVESKGKQYDAVELADQVVRAWDDVLHEHGLLA